MKLVIVESPFAGTGETEAERQRSEAENITYARACVRDSVLRGEAPIASHLLLTQTGILDDNVPAERQLGIEAGLAWKRHADLSAVYTDRGISRGMQYGIDTAKAAGVPVEYRSLHDDR